MTLLQTDRGGGIHIGLRHGILLQTDHGGGIHIGFSP